MDGRRDLGAGYQVARVPTYCTAVTPVTSSTVLLTTSCLVTGTMSSLLVPESIGSTVVTVSIRSCLDKVSTQPGTR